MFFVLNEYVHHKIQFLNHIEYKRVSSIRDLSRSVGLLLVNAYYNKFDIVS